jgi:type II secretory pathway predicted ATPase ExeA
MMKKLTASLADEAMERILEATSSSVFGFFGLHENPFSINPNPRFLYLTPLTQAASQQLVDGIRNRKGLILLTGEVGTGKTLLLRRLLDWLAQQKMPTALIFNSHLNPDPLLDLILSDFGVPCESSLKSDRLISLNRWLLDRYRLGQTPVLIVDEAQGLPRRTLEEIRLLLNLETPRGKLLQVILAGQLELEEKLRRHELRQLRQRITVRCRTAPLTSQETQAYIEQSLRIAGASEPIFQPQAAAFVHAYSQGILRVINPLCENSLINACAEGSRIVSSQFVERAAHDCQLDQVDSVSRELNSNYPAGAPLAEISSIFTGMSLPDAAPPSEVYSVDFSVLTEIPPAAIDSEVHVQRRDSRSGKTATVLEDLPQKSDLRVYPDAMVVTENPTVFASSLRNADGAQSKCASSANAVQTRTSTPTSPVRNPQPLAGFSHATISLFQAWWRSFSADAHSTWRQLRRLRAQVLKFRPYARESR